MKRGFLLGKFMPPHAGHVALCTAARAQVDELTIMVCWLPDDPISGPKRVAWMRELFPDCRVIGHGGPIAQAPEDDPNFWQTWRLAIRAIHPEPISVVFAGESYGMQLAQELGARFVPLMRDGWEQDGIALSGTAVREDPYGFWRWLPAPVRRDLALRICLHGVESTGKSTLIPKLARQFATNFVPEYGRDFCEVHGLDLTEDDLSHIAAVQHARLDAMAVWSSGVIFTDTDARMTAAWGDMLFGAPTADVLSHAPCHLYLHMADDVPWVDDGTRFFGTQESRDRFAAMAQNRVIGLRQVAIAGDWGEREAAAVAAITAFLAERRVQPVWPG